MIYTISHIIFDMLRIIYRCPLLSDGGDVDRVDGKGRGLAWSGMSPQNITGLYTKSYPFGMKHVRP